MQQRSKFLGFVVKCPENRSLTCCTLTFLLKLLHHLRHHFLVERLSPLDDLDVQAVVNLLKLWNTKKKINFKINLKIRV